MDENAMDMKKRRDAGQAYLLDEALKAEYRACQGRLHRFNTMDRADTEGLRAMVPEILGKAENAWICPPFYCDYGKNIEAGKNLFVNYNCTILDVAKVIFGENCQVAPNVGIYTAGHPVHPDARKTGYEYGKEIVIGDNVWIGGSAVICPGVHIGSNAVIGAGSVVTHDIPAWVIAAGNPCRVIRPVTEEDRRKLFRDELIDKEAWADIVSRLNRM